jgi:hypothetical protein
LELDRLREEGLIIAFDQPMTVADFDDMSLEVQVANPDERNRVTCWCNWPLEVIEGLVLERRCQPEVGVGRTDAPFVEGIRWRGNAIPTRLAQAGGRVRVLLHGDLIRAQDGRGLDANHLPPWLPQRRSGDGVEGGTFDSWFTVIRRG